MTKLASAVENGLGTNAAIHCMHSLTLQTESNGEDEGKARYHDPTTRTTKINSTGRFDLNVAFIVSSVQLNSAFEMRLGLDNGPPILLRDNKAWDDKSKKSAD